MFLIIILALILIIAGYPVAAIILIALGLLFAGNHRARP